MKRKAAWCGLSFLLGTALRCAFGDRLAVICIAPAAIAALFWLAFPRYRSYALASGISVLCAVFAAQMYWNIRITPALELSGRTVTVEGYASEVKALGSDRALVTVDGEADGRSVKVCFFTDRLFEPYEKVRITGKVSKLEDTPAFPGWTYYSPKGIYLQGSADTAESLGESGSVVKRWINALRDYSAGSISSGMSDSSAGFAQAMICGDRSELGDAEKTRLYRAGVGHIFALSGTHLAVLAAVFSTIFGTVIHSRRKRAIALEAVILLYMAFGGFSPSLVRAGIMASLVFCSTFFGRRTDVLSSLGICAIVMCGIDPLVCTTASFICSFGCCFAIGAVAPALIDRLPKTRFSAILRPVIQTEIMLAVMMPLFAVMFTEVSVIAPVSNLIIVPLCTAAVALIPIALLMGGTTLPAQIILRLADLLIRAAMKAADLFASLPGAAVGCKYKIAILIGSAVLIGALIYTLRGGRIRVFCSAFAAVAVCLWAVQSVSNSLSDRIKVVLFSDGRSMCALAEYGGSCSLFDISAKGGYIYGVQQELSYSGIFRCRTAFVSGDLGASDYKTQLFPAFEELRTGFGYYSEPFLNGYSAELSGSFRAARTEDGYELSAGDKLIRLTKDRAEIVGEGYIYPKDLGGKAEIVIEN